MEKARIQESLGTKTILLYMMCIPTLYILMNMYMTEYNGLLWNGPRVECSEVRRWTRFVQNQVFWHYTTRMSVDWLVTTVSFFCVFGVLPRDVHEQWEKRRWGVLTGSPCLEGIRTQTLIERERERLGKTTTTTTTTGRTNKGSKERHTHTPRMRDRMGTRNQQGKVE